MKRLFQIGQIVEIRVLDDGFSPDDYYVVTIVAIHKVGEKITYYTSSPAGAMPIDGSEEDYVLHLYFEQSLDTPLCLISGAIISVEVL